MAAIALTGSASGIGAATRRRLEAAGHEVIGVDLRDAEVVADLGTAAGRDAAVAGVLERSGGVLDGYAGFAGVPATVDPPALLVHVSYFGSIAVLDGLRARARRAATAAAPWRSRPRPPPWRRSTRPSWPRASRVTRPGPRRSRPRAGSRTRASSSALARWVAPAARRRGPPTGSASTRWRPATRSRRSPRSPSPIPRSGRSCGRCRCRSAVGRIPTRSPPPRDWMLGERLLVPGRQRALRRRRHRRVGPPGHVLRRERDMEWDHSVDVLVMGSGGAGQTRRGARRRPGPRGPDRREGRHLGRVDRDVGRRRVDAEQPGHEGRRPRRLRGRGREVHDPPHRRHDPRGAAPHLHP